MPTSRYSFTEFFQAYLECALRTSTVLAPGDDERNDIEAPAGFSVDDIEPYSLEVLKAHALSFWSRCWYYIDADEACELPNDGHRRARRLGSDFWLDSQGHGSGAEDGHWPTYGELFSELARKYPNEINFTEDENHKLSIL